MTAILRRWSHSSPLDALRLLNPYGVEMVQIAAERKRWTTVKKVNTAFLLLSLPLSLSLHTTASVPVSLWLPYSSLSDALLHRQ